MLSFIGPYFSIFCAPFPEHSLHFPKSKNVAVPPRLKAIYLWESNSASQEAKTGDKFSLKRAFFCEILRNGFWMKNSLKYFTPRIFCIFSHKLRKFPLCTERLVWEQFICGKHTVALCASPEKKKNHFGRIFADKQTTGSFWACGTRTKTTLTTSSLLEMSEIFL